MCHLIGGQVARQLEGLGAGDTRIGSVLELGLVSSSLCLLPGRRVPLLNLLALSTTTCTPASAFFYQHTEITTDLTDRLLFVTHGKSTFQTVHHQSNQSLVARLVSTTTAYYYKVATSLPIRDTHPPLRALNSTSYPDFRVPLPHFPCTFKNAVIHIETHSEVHRSAGRV